MAVRDDTFVSEGDGFFLEIERRAEQGDVPEGFLNDQVLLPLSQLAEILQTVGVAVVATEGEEENPLWREAYATAVEMATDANERFIGISERTGVPFTPVPNFPDKPEEFVRQYGEANLPLHL